MWVKLQEDPPYLLLNRQINNHEVYVTDYITIWYVYFNENEFLERLLDSNYGLEVDHDELIQNGANFLKNPTDLRKLNIVKGVSTLDISMTKLFEYPLQLKLKLAEGSKEMFFQNVTHMLLKTVADLQASQQELRSLLKKKDEEIEEYKCEGKEIALRYLKTKQFNDEEHMKKHEVHKECADLVNIPERVLDKVVLSTSRNESIKREEMENLKIKEEPMPMEGQTAPILNSNDVKKELKVEPNTRSNSVSPRKKRKPLLNY